MNTHDLKLTKYNECYTWVAFINKKSIACEIGIKSINHEGSTKTETLNINYL